MRKTLIALSAVAILGFVQSQQAYPDTEPTTPTTPETPASPAPVPVPVRKANNITVKFDEQAAKNVSNSIFRVFKKLGDQAADTVYQGAYDGSKGLADAYTNTLGKMIIDYGKIVAPIYRAYADIIEDVNVNKTCNQTCAVVYCFKPDRFNTALNDYDYVFGFRRSCFENDCGCKFNIEAKINTPEGKKEIDGKVKKLQESMNNYNKKIVKLENEAEKIINDKLRYFGKKAQKLQRDFYEDLRTTAINELGCDRACVNTCTDPNYFEFYEVPTCIAECKCSMIKGALDISNGKYTLSSLALYADGDVQAWMSFKKSL